MGSQKPVVVFPPEPPEPQEIESRKPVIVFPRDPPPPDPEAIIKHRIEMKLEYLKKLMQQPLMREFHEDFKTLIELYETGKLSPARPDIVYLQGGQLFETKPEPKEGLLIWTEVKSSLMTFIHTF
jgi:hypothetical protein